MSDVFYIVVKGSDQWTKFANQRNAELEASKLVQKHKDEQFFVMQAVSMAETAPPVAIKAIKPEPERCET